ncbi:MAG: hypothetical protein ABSE16_05225 [Verrucomicrobiota bacterium]|jgi:hypothetical protein
MKPAPKQTDAWEGLPRVCLNPRVRFSQFDWDKLILFSGGPTKPKPKPQGQRRRK